MDPSLLDSSPSTRQYVRRARRGSIVSTDFERTVSATIRVLTPPSLLPESGGIASTLVIIAAVTPATVVVQDSDVVSAAAEGVPDDEEVPLHVPDAPEGNNIIDSIPINKNLVIGIDSGIGVVQVEHAVVAASEEPVQADVTLDRDVPVIEEELAKDHVDDVDMADAHDSYDEVLAEAEDNMAGVQAADMEVTAPVTAHTSPTKIGISF